jgi:fumarylacetoacetate (FAA) hydrolase family protein
MFNDERERLQGLLKDMAIRHAQARYEEENAKLDAAARLNGYQDHYEQARAYARSDYNQREEEYIKGEQARIEKLKRDTAAIISDYEKSKH